MAAVDVESLTITYGDVTAVDDLSFAAEAGEVTCVLGPNGAGKTSTIEALEGLRRPRSGRVSVVGLDPGTDRRALTERIGVMLQEGGIHPAVRVGEAVRHAAALYRSPVDGRALLDTLGLAGLERRSYRQLSGGEQRRLALALALVGRPQVAFLDEPTSGVDPAGRQVIREVVADLRRDGVTVLLTTHDLDEAERVADRVVIIDAGRLVASGSLDELTRATATDEHVRFRGPAGLDTAALGHHLEGARVIETAPGDYAVSAPPTPRVVAALTAWLAEHDLPLADLRAGRQRLEDVYLRLTAGGGDDTSPAGPDHDTTAPAPGRDHDTTTPAGPGHRHDTATAAADPDDPDDPDGPDGDHHTEHHADHGSSALPEPEDPPPAGPGPRTGDDSRDDDRDAGDRR